MTKKYAMVMNIVYCTLSQVQNERQRENVNLETDP